MHAITISDLDSTTGALAFDLRDLLKVIGAHMEQLEWEVTGPECIGARADELNGLAIRGARKQKRIRAVDRLEAVDGPA